jgi:hypothetical protein
MLTQFRASLLPYSGPPNTDTSDLRPLLASLPPPHTTPSGLATGRQLLLFSRAISTQRTRVLQTAAHGRVFLLYCLVPRVPEQKGRRRRRKGVRGGKAKERRERWWRRGLRAAARASRSCSRSASAVSLPPRMRDLSLSSLYLPATGRTHKERERERERERARRREKRERHGRRRQMQSADAAALTASPPPFQKKHSPPPPRPRTHLGLRARSAHSSPPLAPAPPVASPRVHSPL